MKSQVWVLSVSFLMVCGTIGCGEKPEPVAQEPQPVVQQPKTAVEGPDAVVSKPDVCRASKSGQVQPTAEPRA